MPDRVAFEYAVLRVVPRVEREEFLNAGVIVFCEAHDFLEALVELDEARLSVLFPGVDLEVVRAHLEAVPRIARGGPDAGPIGAMPIRERWRWLTATRSTILQTAPAHAGLCHAPRDAMHRLVETLVRPPRAGDVR